MLLLLLAVAYVGWQAVHTVIALNGAARAGAVTAANDVRKGGVSSSQEATDVTTAVNAEQGSTAFSTVTYGTTCVSSCVALRHALAGSRTSVAQPMLKP